MGSTVLGHLQVQGGCKVQTHPVGNGKTYLLALHLDLISKRCLSLNYCSAPLVSIVHFSPWCFWDHLGGFCTPKPAWEPQ